MHHATFITHMNAPWDCNRHIYIYTYVYTYSFPLCLTHSLSRTWMHHSICVTHMNVPWDCQRHVYIYICISIYIYIYVYASILSHCVWHTLYPAYECIMRHLSHMWMHHETVKDIYIYTYIYICIHLFVPTVSDTLSITNMNASRDVYHTYDSLMRMFKTQ